jgi:hypothetical protein
MAASAQQNTMNQLMTYLYPEPHKMGNCSITLNENHDVKTAIENKKKECHSLNQSFFRVLRTSEGVFRFTQLVERIPKFANAVRVELGMSKLPVLDALSSKALGGWTWCTTFARTIEVTPAAIESVKEVRKALKEKTLSTDQMVYKAEQAVSDLTEATAMWGYSVSMVASVFPNAGAVAKTFYGTAESATFTQDVLSLHMNGQNLLRAHKVDVKGATEDMKATIAETKKYNLIAMAKDICSIASGALGLYLLATGAAIASGFVLATLSLAATALAVTRKLYSETMMFRPITFLDNKQVSLITG